jgi:hypothetical protein
MTRMYSEAEIRAAFARRPSFYFMTVRLGVDELLGELAAAPSSAGTPAEMPAVGWHQFLGPQSTTHIAYVHEDGEIYVPEADVPEDWFHLAAAAPHGDRCWRLVEAKELTKAQDRIELLERSEARLIARLSMVEPSAGSPSSAGESAPAEVTRCGQELTGYDVHRGEFEHFVCQQLVPCPLHDPKYAEWTFEMAEMPQRAESAPAETVVVADLGAGPVLVRGPEWIDPQRAGAPALTEPAALNVTTDETKALRQEAARRALWNELAQEQRDLHRPTEGTTP